MNIKFLYRRTESIFCDPRIAHDNFYFSRKKNTMMFSTQQITSERLESELKEHTLFVVVAILFFEIESDYVAQAGHKHTTALSHISEELGLQARGTTPGWCVLSLKGSTSWQDVKLQLSSTRQ